MTGGDVPPPAVNVFTLPVVWLLFVTLAHTSFGCLGRG